MIDVEMLNKGIAAHSGWKARLRNAAISGKLETAISTVKADDQCDFGKWLYGSVISTAEKQTEQYRTVRQLHMLCPSLFDGVQIRGLGGQIEQSRSNAFDPSAHRRVSAEEECSRPQGVGRCIHAELRGVGVRRSEREKRRIGET